MIRTRRNIRIAVILVVLSLLGASSMPITTDDATATFSPTSSTSGISDERAESCRMKLLNEWVEQNSIRIGSIEEVDEENAEGFADAQSSFFDFGSLAEIQKTTLFKTIVDDCRYYVEAFNAAAGKTCVLQESHWDNSYSDLWKIGPINMDGNWLLAADVLLSNNLEDSRPLVPCCDSCYKRNPQSDTDCQEFGTAGTSLVDIASITSISVGDSGLPKDVQTQYKLKAICDLGWLETDKAYQNLRWCAAESNVARTMIAELDTNNQGLESERNRRASSVAKEYRAQRQKQAECAASMKMIECPSVESAPEDEIFVIDNMNDDISATGNIEIDSVSVAAPDVNPRVAMGIAVAATSAFVALLL